MRKHIDRAAQVKAEAGKLEVRLNDFCDYFEQDTSRLFSAHECWYCKYADFGIYTEHPTEMGICKYHEHKRY